jgi:integrase
VKLTELKPAKRFDQPADDRDPLARNTVRNIHATLRAMLKAAVDDGVLLANPARKLGRQLRLVAPKATRQEEIKAMTRDERHLFVTTAEIEVPLYALLFWTLAGTGMRLGEGLALQPDNVDELAREIRVARTLSAGQIETPKSGHGRTVDISQALAVNLARRKQELAEEALLRDGPDPGCSARPREHCSMKATCEKPCVVS